MVNDTKPQTEPTTEPRSAACKAAIASSRLQFAMSKHYMRERYDIARGVWHCYRLGDYYRESYEQMEKSCDGHPAPDTDRH